MNIILHKNQKVNQIKAYTYLLIYENLKEYPIYYYGVRYGNIKQNTSPENDIFCKYFTSSNLVNSLIKENILPSKIIIHKIFENHIDACKFEVKFLTKIKADKRKDFLNQVCHFDNSLPNNSGRIFSEERKLKMSKTSSLTQNDPDYKIMRSKIAKEKWSDKDFIKYMEEKNNTYWNSPEGLIRKEKNGESFKNKKHSTKTKEQMKIRALEACAKQDCKARAAKRKRYKCKYCEMLNLDGANLQRHMISKHNSNKEEVKEYKFTYSHIL